MQVSRALVSCPPHLGAVPRGFAMGQAAAASWGTGMPRPSLLPPAVLGSPGSLLCLLSCPMGPAGRRVKEGLSVGPVCRAFLCGALLLALWRGGLPSSLLQYGSGLCSTERSPSPCRMPGWSRRWALSSRLHSRCPSSCPGPGCTHTGGTRPCAQLQGGCKVWLCVRSSSALLRVLCPLSPCCVAGGQKQVSGCRGRLLDTEGSSLGQFLCYDLSCRTCSEATWEMQRWLCSVRESPWASSGSESPSSFGSSLYAGRSVRRRLIARRGGLPQRGLEALGPLAPAAALPDLTLHRQASALAGSTHALLKSHSSNEASSTTALGLCMADGSSSLPGGASPHLVSRLELGEDFWRRLRTHTKRKCLETHLGSLPTLVQRSYEASARKLMSPAPPAPLHSGAVPTYFHTMEALFLPEEAREALELHIRAKRLHHQWGLPGSSVGAPPLQALEPAPQQHHADSHGQLLPQHPPCLPQATQHSTEPQPDCCPLERDDEQMSRRNGKEHHEVWLGMAAGCEQQSERAVAQHEGGQLGQEIVCDQKALEPSKAGSRQDESRGCSPPASVKMLVWSRTKVSAACRGAVQEVHSQQGHGGCAPCPEAQGPGRLSTPAPGSARRSRVSTQGRTRLLSKTREAFVFLSQQLTLLHGDMKRAVLKIPGLHHLDQNSLD